MRIMVLAMYCLYTSKGKMHVYIHKIIFQFNYIAIKLYSIFRFNFTVFQASSYLYSDLICNFSNWGERSEPMLVKFGEWTVRSSGEWTDRPIFR